MATSKKAAAPKIATKVAAGFPAKSAPTKLSPKVALEVDAAAEKAKKPTRAKKAVVSPVEVAGKALAAASTKPMRAKAATKPVKAPAVVARAGKLLAADPKGVPGTKRVVKDTGLPTHGVTSVAEMAKVLADFPRGSTFDFMDDHLDVYNLRGKLVAQVFKADKPAKGAKK